MHWDVNRKFSVAMKMILRIRKVLIKSLQLHCAFHAKMHRTRNLLSYLTSHATSLSQFSLFVYGKHLLSCENPRMRLAKTFSSEKCIKTSSRVILEIYKFNRQRGTQRVQLASSENL